MNTFKFSVSDFSQIDMTGPAKTTSERKSMNRTADKAGIFVELQDIYGVSYTLVKHLDNYGKSAIGRKLLDYTVSAASYFEMSYNVKDDISLRVKSAEEMLRKISQIKFLIRQIFALNLLVFENYKPETKRKKIKGLRVQSIEALGKLCDAADK